MDTCRRMFWQRASTAGIKVKNSKLQSHPSILWLDSQKLCAWWNRLWCTEVSCPLLWWCGSSWMVAQVPSALPVEARTFPGHIQLGWWVQRHRWLHQPTRSQSDQGSIVWIFKAKTDLSFQKRLSAGFCSACWGAFSSYFNTVVRLQKTCWVCLSALISSVINASLIFPAALLGRRFSFTKSVKHLSIKDLSTNWVFFISMSNYKKMCHQSAMCQQIDRYLAGGKTKNIIKGVTKILRNES